MGDIEFYSEKTSWPDMCQKSFFLIIDVINMTYTFCPLFFVIVEAIAHWEMFFR